MALVVTAVSLSLSAGDAAIVTTEPPLAKQPKAGNCSGDRFRKDRPNPISCCQVGDHTYATPDGKTLVFRSFAKPCTEADGRSTNCVVQEEGDPQACVYGACGGKIEWRVKAEKVHIFKPVSRPEQCGWAAVGNLTCIEGDCKDWPTGGRSKPESFTNQTEYPGVTATCPFAHCVRGGTPTP